MFPNPYTSMLGSLFGATPQAPVPGPMGQPSNLPLSAQVLPPNTITGQTPAPQGMGGGSQADLIRAIASIYQPQPRTDAGWGTNNATSAQDWAKMFNNTGVLGGTMQSSVAPGTNPGLATHAAMFASQRGAPMATSLFNMATNRPSQMNPTYNPLKDNRPFAFY